MEKIYFLSFGSPSNNYHEALERICNQAKSMNIFEKVIGLTEKDLINDSEFWNKHQNFILENSRGYGYWLWKPYIIKKTLESINNEDILLYLDSGCELNSNGLNKLLKYIELVKIKKIIGTKGGSSDYNYTKMDLIKYLNMENNIDLLKKNHMQPGCVLIMKCNETVNLYNEYYEIGSNNYHFINDNPSIEKNFDGFKEHRHDQSIFNLLVKKYNLINYDLDPTDWGYGHEAKNNYLKNGIEYPIWTCRNRTGKSIIE